MGNGLAAMLQAMAAGSGDRLECDAIAFPNVSLDDHWTPGDAVRAIRKSGWTQRPRSTGRTAVVRRRSGRTLPALAIYRGLTARPPQVFESFRSPSGAFPEVNIQPATAR